MIEKTMPKKILLMSVSAGSGHVRAAEAIRASASLYDEALEVRHLDVLDYVPTGFRKLYAETYLNLVEKLPAVWGYLYQASHEAKPDSTTEKIRRSVEHLSTRPLRKEITAFNPDVIVCTHFLPAEMLDRMLREGNLGCPVWVQVTDFDLHRMWVHEHMTGYFAANEEVAFRMRAAGIPSAHIHITGIPIMPAFSQPLAREVCAAEYGMDAQRTTVLLMGGGAVMNSLIEVAQSLLQIGGDFQLVVLAGRNAIVLASLQKLAVQYPGRLFPQAFTDKVERLMTCADLVITKPGGLSTSECLVKGLPVILYAPIPGQEERNADYLLEQGVALKACDVVTLEYRVRLLLDDSSRLATMRDKAHALGRPDAGKQVLETLLGE
ncbi:MAG: glycosyltransferase [Candidatus Thiodiazotropha sp.]